jgi:hypothetical protein
LVAAIRAAERRQEVVVGVWESVLLTVVGGLMAAGAGTLGAAMQARQTARVRADEQKREDRYRLHQDCVAAYTAFHLSASAARRIMQNTSGNTDDDGAERRAARNDTHLAYVKIALVGDAGVVIAARRMMIYIDTVVYRQARFDTGEWTSGLDSFQEAARFSLTGHRDLVHIMSDMDWPAPPQHRRPDRT